MPERRYLTGAIQKGGRLTEGSVRFLQIGCGITNFQLPVGRERYREYGNPPLLIGTEKNGGLAEGVARGKYDFAIAGLDTVVDLPDYLVGMVKVVRNLGFQHCDYRLGISAEFFGVERLDEIPAGTNIPKTLRDLPDGTQIAAKYANFLAREIGRRRLNLETIYDPTPETAPKFRKIFVVADNVETGKTFNFHQIEEGEVLLRSQAVLVVAKRLSRGVVPIFYNQLLPLVDQALANPGPWLNPAQNPESPGSAVIESAGRGRNRLLDVLGQPFRRAADAVAAMSSGSAAVVGVGRFFVR